MQIHPLLQIPCSIQLSDHLDQSAQNYRKTPVRTFVDTGAQVSVLSVDGADRAGVLQMIDRRYAGKAQGVGQCRVLGRLPAGVLHLHMHGHSVKSPAITILEHTNDGVELLLGLDFLRDHGAILNLRNEEMILADRGGDVSIPFIRPRATLNLGEEESVQDCWQDRRLCQADRYDEEQTEEEETQDCDMSGV
jgi:hypothetical protein